MSKNKYNDIDILDKIVLVGITELYNEIEERFKKSNGNLSIVPSLPVIIDILIVHVKQCLFLKEVRKNSDFLKVKGFFPDIVYNMSDVIREYIEDHPVEELPITGYPLTTKGSLYAKYLISTGFLAPYNKYAVSDNLECIYQYRVENDTVYAEVYLRAQFISVITVDEDYRANAFYLLGSFSYDPKNCKLSVDGGVQIDTNVNLSTDLHVYSGLIFNANTKEFRALNHKQVKELYTEDLDKAYEVLKNLASYFIFFCTGLNYLRIIYTKYQSKKVKSSTVPSVNHISTTHKLPTAPVTESTITIDLSDINSLDSVHQLVRKINKQINHSRTYSISEWQVCGYTRRLPNGELHYFPPSVRRRHKETIQGQNLTKNKQYEIEGF